MDAPYGTVAADPVALRPMNLTRLMGMHSRGEKITAISACDATYAATAALAGVECIVVGGENVTGYQGLARDASIAIETLAYHVRNVSQGLRRAHASAWVISDLPPTSQGLSRDLAMRHAVALLHAGAQMVCLQVDENFESVTSFLIERGIPVCGHLKKKSPTLYPAVVKAIGDTGAQFAVLEGMDDEAVSAFSKALPHCVTLGVHSGVATSGQLLSLISLLGLDGGSQRESRARYLSKTGSIGGALAAWVADVKTCSHFSQ
jgi:3-methyl-2-oxobutanoate hydroxymethyltransferase